MHAGANVKALQRMLGHKNASMTLDVYADLFDSDLMDVARMLDAAVQVETDVKECGQNVGKSVLEPRMKPSETLESRHSREWWFFSKLKDALS